MQYRRAVDVARRLADRHPNEARYQGGLGSALHALGLLCLKKGEKFEEPRHLFEEAVPHQRKAVQLDPATALYRDELRNHYRSLAGALLLLPHTEIFRLAARL